MLTTVITATMTSREMADLTEKRHDSVKRTIATLVKAGAIGEPHRVEYLDGLNRKAIEYAVCKRDSYVIVAQLSPMFTARLVDRWQELEARAPAPVELSRMELLELAMQTERERLALAEKIAADAPKVAFAEIIRAMDGVCRIGDFCKTMKAGRNKLFARMKADKILMENRMPYQKYIDKGYFSVIEQKPYTDSKGVSHPAFTTMVTGAGQLFLTRKYHDLTGAA